ncbi:ATP-binding protein [Streptomyces spiralis]
MVMMMSKVLAGHLPRRLTQTMATRRMANVMKDALATSRARRSAAAGRSRDCTEPSHLELRVVPDDPDGLSSVRTTLGEQLGKWGVDSVSDTAALLASELLTNALRHSGGSALFMALPLINAVRLEVYDSCTATPHRREAAEDDVSGRGMMLVEALARSWGVDRCPIGKRVWCEIAVAGG